MPNGELYVCTTSETLPLGTKYTAEFRPAQFWISIGGKEVKAKGNLEGTIMPVILEGQGNQGPSGSQ